MTPPDDTPADWGASGIRRRTGRPSGPTGERDPTIHALSNDYAAGAAGCGCPTLGVEWLVAVVVADGGGVVLHLPSRPRSPMTPGPALGGAAGRPGRADVRNGTR
jgi:hypothetical protein